MSWADWRSEIAKACDGSHWTIEGIESRLSDGTWGLLEGRGCCFIVEVQPYETEKSCTVWWAAGDLEAIKAALEDLHAWAIRRGCTEMLVEGQPGWARVLKNDGYRVWSVTLRRGLYGHLH